MTDRELLELAAKAAGGLVHVADMGWIHEDADGNRGAWWRPLDDDGDALRLAVKLNLNITYDGNDNAGVDVTVFGNYDDYTGEQCIETYSRQDGYAATRRAIVRAAAEIGRTK